MERGRESHPLMGHCLSPSLPLHDCLSLSLPPLMDACRGCVCLALLLPVSPSLPPSLPPSLSRPPPPSLSLALALSFARALSGFLVSLARALSLFSLVRSLARACARALSRFLACADFLSRSLFRSHKQRERLCVCDSLSRASALSNTSDRGISLPRSPSLSRSLALSLRTVARRYQCSSTREPKPQTPDPQPSTLNHKP
jgi:hypothetical protein